MGLTFLIMISYNRLVSMPNTIHLITVAQLQRAIIIKQRITTLEPELPRLLRASSLFSARSGWQGRRASIPASTAKIVAGQKRRWAKWRREQGKSLES